MTDYRVVLCTCPSNKEAQKLAQTLVEEALCACVNIVGNVQSIYRWEEKICNDQEYLLVIKTSASSFNKLKSRMAELHSYDCPEIISLPIDDGHAPYLEWIGAQIMDQT